MARLDPHSFTDSTQPRVRHLRLRLSVDFPARRLAAEAALELEAPSEGILDLDSKGIDVLDVTNDAGARVAFELGPEEPILGQRLRLVLPAGTRQVRLRYRTSPEAPGLQWLDPEQTAGGRQPFLFSQCQPIHARSLVPVPDTARSRITYEAEVAVPAAARSGDVRRPGGRGRRPERRHARLPLPHAPAHPSLPDRARGRRAREARPLRLARPSGPSPRPSTLPPTSSRRSRR